MYAPHICHIVIFDCLLEIGMDIHGSSKDAKYMTLRLHESKDSIENRKKCLRKEKKANVEYSRRR